MMSGSVVMGRIRDEQIYTRSDVGRDHRGSCVWSICFCQIRKYADFRTPGMGCPVFLA